MKILCKWMICLLCIIASVQPLWAKEKNVVAVLPFSVISSENIDFIRQGIVNMVSSRLSVNEKIEVIGRDRVQPLLPGSGGKELTPVEVLALGKKVDADFVVWGSITKIGNNLSIDGKLFDVAANKSALAFVAQSQGMDEVIPKINDFTQRIENHIGVAPPQIVSGSPMTKDIIVSRQQQPPTPQSAREAEIISGMKSGKKGTMTALINPDFINAEQPLNRDTFWKSQQYPYEIKGMDIGDVNGDGLNETVTIDQTNVFIYQRKGAELTLLQQIKGNSYDNYIALDVADINGNGVKEIIVTNQYNRMVRSFVIEYKNGKFVPIATGLNWFLRVVDTGYGMPLLLGQRLGINEIAFELPIYEIVWRNGEYREGAKMRIPQGLSVFSLTISKLSDNGPEKIIALSEDDYLRVFEQTDKPISEILIFGGSDVFIWKSEEYFGGSSNAIQIRDPNSTQAQASGGQNAYANLRILTYDTNKDGKREVIIVRNNSTSGRMFQNVKLFSSAEVFDLEWDNLGMVENWRTKKINGYVSDYQFKDIDNDGENEVVLSLVVSVGGSLRGRSVLVAYELNKP